MADKDFSYKFCKENQLLPEVGSESILIFHTDDCDVNAIAHIQSKYKLPIETKQIDFSEFNKKLWPGRPEFLRRKREDKVLRVFFQQPVISYASNRLLIGGMV